ncbi:tryptophan-rich sensory protein [Altererythrobacter atlanticus]|uniref:TspO/MBR family protein n=1 Tax=Croceibacterium atlanticum TaxID=1267766 RepID=A0A0F7KSG8_9SPHN|nr:TspO/MBR family protein [Croceibacterium atlanticum]AKH42217.1 TspO/MBR family protein [Croceibacterium atlanticum]MBB5733971.1 tryptophan-rich sensory protein [Croceibacterium atlanticum]
MNRLASTAQLRASFLRWALFIVPAIVLLGILSGLLAGSGADNPWFAALEKPSLFPPSATFGIVWTILYILMGLSLALICTAWGARYRFLAIVAFLLQFVLNLAWSPIFFGEHQITIALVILVALDLAVLLTLALFWMIRRTAGLLLLPYLAWVLFATLLNWQILQLNPEADGVDNSYAVQRIEL